MKFSVRSITNKAIFLFYFLLLLLSWFSNVEQNIVCLAVIVLYFIGYIGNRTHTHTHTFTVICYWRFTVSLYTFIQTSSDGNQTTSTLSITLNRSDAGRYLSCRAYNHAVPSDALEDGWRLDIQCKSR